MAKSANMAKMANLAKMARNTGHAVFGSSGLRGARGTATKPDVSAPRSEKSDR
jgi:hypothetical protein